MRDLVDSISPVLRDVMSELGVEENDWSDSLAGSTDSAYADVTLPCHSLSRILRKSPAIIADEVALLLGDSLNGICSVSSVNGFLNFSADADWLSSIIEERASDTRIGVDSENPRVIVIDYSSPNVAKHMHVGHLRSTVIGDALARMLAHKGHQVIGENHIGDWGTPFGMLIEHLLDIGVDTPAEKIDLGTFYTNARAKFESDSIFADRSRKRVVKMQASEPETITHWQMLVDRSLIHFNEVYQMMGVLLTDDNLAGESKYESSLSEVVERLDVAGILKQSEGAHVVFPKGWVNREGEPLPLIIRKADGGYNYATTDLACIIDRVEEIGSTEFLYVVGAEQAQHFAMLFQVAREAGFMDDRINAIHVPFGMVLGTDGKKLASRTGGAVHLKDLLIEAVERADSMISEKNPNLSDEERKEVARMLGIGAIKYADLSTDRTNNYTFDWEKMLSFDGNTAPYLQYAHARICSIFAKSGIVRSSIQNSSISLIHEREQNLARRLIGFPEALDNAISHHLPHKLATQLHSIAQAFASFYEVCPVLKADDEATINSRLALCDLTARTLECGLGLLGIESPNRM
ncbi:MAG: arginine--tRNA ligase [Candidatus Thalassarchaeaceae archaeon]|jgi:arginyl-tRNA synthetase|nr:arginine--tRNA ligase [Candidatus Thalassarchaeaceae archaeon]MDP6318295.1 arginine--tRNA ligase [Candidatus Thalassarchaeaceae archaeon]HJM29499.1 arginine--tRNA ligase [Candidatus Thalassarchaeaceae archaeon]|tara:strand:- start:1370 stop:3100 length:1731 start_codon:yes stop_codon:yes gene_type:complete